MNNYIRCINCDNHEDHEMACKLKNPNYIKRNDPTTDLTECFVKNKLHESLDNILELTNKLINKKKPLYLYKGFFLYLIISYVLLSFSNK